MSDSWVDSETKSTIREFRASIRNERGDSVEKRRTFLVKLLAVAGLAAAEPIVNAASARASALEVNSDSNAALLAVQREVYSIGEDHMKPGMASSVMRARALAAWRDAAAIRGTKLSRTGVVQRARDVEAQAAGLVAQFCADRGNEYHADLWYTTAHKLAQERGTRSWLYSCSAWGPLYIGSTTEAARRAAKGAALSNWMTPERAMFGYGQLARVFALEGNAQKARQSLSEANRNYLLMTDEHRDTKPNLLFFTPIQHAQYMADTLGILAFGQDAEPSDIRRADMFADMALDSDYRPNGMNYLIIQLTRAKLLASGKRADADAAAAHGMKTLSELSDDDRTGAVAKSKALQLSRALSERFEARSVRAFKGFVDELVAA